MAARRVVQESLRFKGVGLTNPPKCTVEIVNENPRLSNPDFGLENENPGALARAAGADMQTNTDRGDDTLIRLHAARALADATAACDPDDRVLLLERLLDTLRPGWPIPAFMGRVMEEAGFWADMASRVELKAYALACYRRMTPADQAAFLGFVQGEAA